MARRSNIHGIIVDMILLIMLFAISKVKYGSNLPGTSGSKVSTHHQHSNHDKAKMMKNAHDVCIKVILV